MLKRLVVSTLFLCLVTTVALGQSAPKFDFYERGPYQEGIPRPEEILGYAIGARHSYHYQMVDYILALDQASPRVKVIEYGTSYEGRKLHLVLISSEANIQKLEELRAATEKLTDPRTIANDAELSSLLASTPATVWLNFANDGNESAAFETGMQISYQLAAGEDETTRKIRDQVITIVNPAHNPESHDRFVTWYRAVTTGPGGNPDPNAAEHGRDWLMDSNDTHFHVDPNRDAIILSQQVTRAVVKQIHRWNPQVFIDHHGNPPTFFFPPVAKPVNENFPASARKWESTFGRAIGAEFDRFGWPYMNRETYDLHYPGYFDSYPAFNGAIGMTFETDGGGSQGLQLERADGTHSTLRGAIAKHYSGSMAVLTASANDRETLLRDFYNFRKVGMDEAQQGPARQYVLLEGNHPSRAAALVTLLRKHRIEVSRATQDFSSRRTHNYFSNDVGPHNFPAGSYVVPANQPQKRLLTALLEKEAKLNDDFVAVARARMARNKQLGKDARKERIGFYDMTAWNLALAFGVEAYWTEDVAPNTEPVTGAIPLPRGVQGGRANHAYLYKPDSNAALRLTAQLFKEDFNLLVTRAELKVEGETFPPGTIFARVTRNKDTLHDRIRELAEETGVQVWATDSSWTVEGLSLGTRQAVDLKAPKVAIASYEPTNGRAFGHLWFYFEKMIEYPFTSIRTDRLGSIDLSEYDVIILPEGSPRGYERRLGKDGIKNLKQWVQNGGVFIGFKGGAAFATGKDVELTSSHLYGRPLSDEAKKEMSKEEAAKIEAEVFRTPGAMLRAKLNQAHFLTYGYEGETVVLHNTNYLFTPSEEGTNVVTYAEENPRITGFMWEDTESRIPGTAYLIDENVGRGHAILFADDPLFRLLFPNLERLFTNAVFLAPSMR